jgi:hypothetical protein
MEVFPNVGIGPLRFGMNPAQVLALFSEQQIYEDWMGGNLNDSLLYHGLIIGFDECDGDGPLAHSRFREVRLNRREDTVLWGRNLFDWTKPAVTDHLENGGLPYRLAACGDVSVPDLSLLLAFDESSRLEYVEMWASHVRPEHIVGPERRQFVSQVARFFQRLF